MKTSIEFHVKLEPKFQSIEVGRISDSIWITTKDVMAGVESTTFLSLEQARKLRSELFTAIEETSR